MQPLWLRYIRLLSIVVEARIEIALSRWSARVLSLLISAIAGGMALFFAAVGLAAWVAGAANWGKGFLVGAGLWAVILILQLTYGQVWLRRRLTPQEALYRLRLAQAGIRLIEKSLRPPAFSSLLVSNLYRYLGNLIWSLIRRWLRKWIPFL
ncbi:MAG: hypothetical protein N2253_02745 [Bacteroidia bacterium]|nr:hypothetical protein [Bacteroidia bacterium]MCX7763795.1 hypothetical protein [Bacteroidia bacterium]MDW8056924.1 hypothetical protein [Bacteroidia bacterium]